jgi:hypothetical protein
MPASHLSARTDAAFSTEYCRMNERYGEDLPRAKNFPSSGKITGKVRFYGPSDRFASEISLSAQQLAPEFPVSAEPGISLR